LGVTQAEVPSSSGRNAQSRRSRAVTEEPEQSSSPTSLSPSQVAHSGDVLHPRGRIWPPLPASAPAWRRFVRALVRLGQGLHYHDVFRAAPAMAFHFFLSLLPLLVFIGYVVGLVARRRGVSAVLGLVLDNLPATTAAILKNEVARLANADRLGPLAAVGFLWIASGGTQGLMVAVESVVGAPRRAWWKQRLFAASWVITTLVACGVAAFGIIEWDEVVHSRPAATVAAVIEPIAQDAADPTAHKSSSRVDPRTSPLHSTKPAPAPVKRTRKILRSGGERVLTLAFSLSAAVGGLCAFYRFAVSHARRVRRRVLPGAVLAVALWIVVSWGFGLYLRTLASYTVYYGSLAAVAVLMVWLWLMSLAILIGAELNSQLEGLRDELGPTSRS
jgi:membrane protein